MPPDRRFVRTRFVTLRVRRASASPYSVNQCVLNNNATGQSLPAVLLVNGIDHHAVDAHDGVFFQRTRFDQFIHLGTEHAGYTTVVTVLHDKLSVGDHLHENVLLPSDSIRR